jgi:protein-tyrosine phosphatase
MLSQQRRLPFPNLLNARDLGGCPTRDGRYTRWQSLLRTDDLHQLTPDGVNAMLAYGVRTVIDLRWPAEVECHPSVFQLDPGGLQYVHISLLGQSEEAWRERRPDAPKEMWNSLVLDLARSELAAVLRAIAHAPIGGVLFHCVAGKDRTGIVAALLLALAGVQPTAIVDDYVLSTENLREARLAAYPQAEPEAVLESVRCPPEQVHNMLAHLDRRYGGPAGYLDTIGLSQQETLWIRARLRAEARSST